jgi:hypothetical protein
MHRKLDSDIADAKSLLNTSAQTTKNLKARLKGLTDKKKEAGKAPRNSQAGANRFDIPIPKIQGAAAATIGQGMASSSESIPTTDNQDSDIEMPVQEIAPVDIRSLGAITIETAFKSATADDEDTAEKHEVAPANVPSFSHIPTHELPVFQHPVPGHWHAPGETVNDKSENSKAGSSLMNTTSHWHPGFELPPFDLELFNAALETEPIPVLTAAEVAAHMFLRGLKN